VAVGRITRAHGVKGEVAVLPLSQVPSRFEPGSRLFLDEGRERAVTVAASRAHQQRLLVSFREVPDRTAAEALNGTYLFVPVEEVPAPPEGEFWAHELIGCSVWTESGRALGEVREVVHGPANDWWVAAGDGGETMIPALRDVVRSVDVAQRHIVVADVPGITAPEEENR
jgi:16S rRNA processing protein RimM